LRGVRRREGKVESGEKERREGLRGVRRREGKG
jgi:hypothetical protein